MRDIMIKISNKDMKEALAKGMGSCLHKQMEEGSLANIIATALADGASLTSKDPSMVESVVIGSDLYMESSLSRYDSEEKKATNTFFKKVFGSSYELEDKCHNDTKQLSLYFNQPIQAIEYMGRFSNPVPDFVIGKNEGIRMLKITPPLKMESRYVVFIDDLINVCRKEKPDSFKVARKVRH